MDYKSAEIVLRDFLREQKLRVTDERFKVLKSSLGIDHHFTADELYVQLCNEDVQISRATVYNTMEVLVQCGIFVKREFQNGIHKYEVNLGRPQHDHMICTECGYVSEFSDDKIKQVQELIAEQQGIEIVNYTFNVYTKCHHSPGCRNKN